MDRDGIEANIKNIEDGIRRASRLVHFGDPSFSEWYETQVDEIKRLKELLK